MQDTRRMGQVEGKHDGSVQVSTRIRAAEARAQAPDGIVIERIREMDQMRAAERLQMAIWGADQAWVIPSHVLYIAAESGGIVLGAYEGASLVGFVLGFLGQHEGRLYHASHMLGIHPSLQSHGIGAALKWRQREEALAQGLDLMTWTFDPLEGRNAYFNLHKLGAMARVYREDLYGAMDDALNRGLPSDRLMVEWHLRYTSAPVALEEPPVPILLNQNGMPRLQLDGAGRALSLALPRTIQELKHADPKAALAWRLAVREAFRWAFDRGYVARDVRDGAYVLVREDDQDSAR
jgi:predicted GNAT superfamily acetyltransferase